MVRLLPKEEKFFDYFDQASERAVKAIKVLKKMMQDLSNAEERAKEIVSLEHECDNITHEAVSALHKTFITPIERDSIYSLITRLDDVIDFVDSVAERVLLYKIKTSMPEAISLIDTLENAIEQVANGVRKLRNLEDPRSILIVCVEINRLENEGDKIFRNALSVLFDSTSDPIEIIKWKDIYETLEDAVDRCEDVANILEGIVVENV